MTASSDTLRSTQQPPSPAGPSFLTGPRPLGPHWKDWEWAFSLVPASLTSPFTSCPLHHHPGLLRLPGRSEPVASSPGALCNWWETCSFCAVYNERLCSVYVSSSEATAMHNGTKTLSITNGCVRKCVCAEMGGGWVCRGCGLEGGRSL